MHIYVDESGSSKGGQQYFTIAAVIPNGRTGWKRLRNLVNRHCASLGVSELKAYHMNVPQKQDFLRRLRRSRITGEIHKDYELHYIVVDKGAITNPSLRREGNLMFNYAFRYLAEPIVRGTSENVKFILDERNEKVSSRNSLGDYLKLEAIRWGCTQEIKLAYTDSQQIKLVQVADIVANSVLAKYQYGHDHFYNMLDITRSQQFPRASFRTVA